MPRTCPDYPREFHHQMVDLVRSGRSPEELAKEFEPSSHSIRHWVAVADRRDRRCDETSETMSASERDELSRLRRDVKQLRQERDILSRAAAWFAREADMVPSRSSKS